MDTTFSRTLPGHPLRTLLRERLVEAYIEGDRRLIEQREAEAAARADRTPEDIERVRQLAENHPELFFEFGYGGQPRRQRPEVPNECHDEIFLELLALLGPDLGEDGAKILRRVAQDAPWLLAPALEAAPHRLRARRVWERTPGPFDPSVLPRRRG